MIDNDTANEDRCIARGAQHFGYHDRLVSCVDANEPMGTCEDTSVPHPRNRRDWTHHPTSGSCRSWTPTAPIPDEGAREAWPKGIKRAFVDPTNSTLQKVVYEDLSPAIIAQLTTELAEARRELTRYDDEEQGTVEHADELITALTAERERLIVALSASQSTVLAVTAWRNRNTGAFIQASSTEWQGLDHALFHTLKGVS